MKSFLIEKKQGLYGALCCVALMAISLVLLYCFGATIDVSLSMGTTIVCAVFALVFAVLSFVLVNYYFGYSKEIRIKSFTLNPFICFVLIAFLSFLIAFFSVFIFRLISPDSPFSKGRLSSLFLCFLYFLVILSFFAIAASKNRHDHIAVEENKKENYTFGIGFFLAVYFFLCALPYLFTNVREINNFLTKGNTKIIYRAITSLYLYGLALFLAISRKIKPNFSWIIILSTLIITVLVSSYCTPLTITYYKSEYGVLVPQRYSLDFWTRTLSVLKLANECLTFFCFVSFFRPCLTKKREVLIPLIAITAFGLFSVIFSFVKDANLYKDLFLNSKSDAKIMSFFESKNTFGAFLFLSAFSSFYVFYVMEKPVRYVFFALLLFFLVECIIVRCYTALVPTFLLIVIYFVIIIISLFESNKTMAFVALGIGVAAIATIVAALTIPSIYKSSSFLNLVVERINLFFQKELATRTGIWEWGIKIINGNSIFMGQEDALSLFELRMIHDVKFFHSAFVGMYAQGGLFGLFVYLIPIGYVVLSGIQAFKWSKKYAVLVLMLIFTAVLFTMPEDFSLFISMSSISLPFTIVFYLGTPMMKEEYEKKALAAKAKA